ncbi:MAG: hypothetical protein LBR53_07175 [Deltaproteobacteria bacterium]|nr:hypothetical protein [Deltaproteobacteria bacterium]
MDRLAESHVKRSGGYAEVYHDVIVKMLEDAIVMRNKKFLAVINMIGDDLIKNYSEFGGPRCFCELDSGGFLH